MTDYEWTVRGADYDVVVDYARSEFPTRKRGEEASLTFELARRGGNVSATGGQYSGDSGFQWSGDAGAQYAPGSDVAALGERYERLTNYLDFADSVSAGTDAEQVPWYRELVPSRAPVSSHLVGLEPSDEIDGVAGLWGIIVGGEEPNRRIADRAIITFDVFVLAEYDDFADRTAVSNDFEKLP